MAGSCSSGTGSVTRLDTSKFEVAYKQLTEASKNFSSAKEAIDKQTRQLKDCWEGKGADKFDVSYWRLKRELDDEEETLLALADSLMEMYNSYKEWDESTASNIRASGETSQQSVSGVSSSGTGTKGGA